MCRDKEKRRELNAKLKRAKNDLKGGQSKIDTLKFVSQRDFSVNRTS